MCGILGLISSKTSPLSSETYTRLIGRLFVHSESRGREASGIAVATRSCIRVVRKPAPASEMLKTPDYHEAIDAAIAESEANGSVAGIAAIGHARLVTNGMQGIDTNNQPVVKNRVVCVHNGIVVNHQELWNQYPQFVRESDVDTEIIAAILDHEVVNTNSIEAATGRLFAEAYGEASIAVLFSQLDAALFATNTGSLFYSSSVSLGTTFFVSELSIAKRVLGDLPSNERAAFGEIIQIKAGFGCVFDLRTAECLQTFSLKAATSNGELPKRASPRSIQTSADRLRSRLRSLRRCSRCVLPETMPFINFDEKGVCNYCNNYQAQRLKGRSGLEEILAKHRSKSGNPDCLIGFSGGRDSSYALHLLRSELDMNPIAYTYDWGMVTDLARRNQARLCGKLGVEHIWVSADIKAKRRNVKRNVEAWLGRPDLGMVPLFMAGDKQFMYHANRLMKESGIGLMVYATNHFERTDFKVGFCGIPPANSGIRLHKLSAYSKARMAAYYGRNFLTNPGYLNSSLFDTFTAFLSYYFVNQDFLYLFDYLAWNEQHINRVLTKEYDWELATDTKTTWRIGDGTAPFYNYIYQTVAGFSEYETFRSNQIREGVMSRDEAVQLINEENLPRFESMQEYCRVIGVDFDSAMRVIDMIPKRY